MATNANNPRGLIFGRISNAGDSAVREFPIARGHNVRIGKGDPVKYDPANKTLTRASAGDTNCVGVFMGVRYKDAATKWTVRRVVWEEGTNPVLDTPIVAFVLVDPDHEFVIQSDAALDDGAIGQYADFAAVGNGSLQWGSKAKLGTAGNTAAQLVIVGPYESPDNEQNAAYNKMVVRWNEHAYK